MIDLQVHPKLSAISREHEYACNVKEIPALTKEQYDRHQMVLRFRIFQSNDGEPIPQQFILQEAQYID